MEAINYIQDIETVFGDFIKGSNIVCSVDEFKLGFKKLKKMIQSRSIVSEKKPRKQSGFFKWLNSDGKRNSIKDEYFADFDAWEDWSEKGITLYYEKKNLPIDKLNILIEKKKNFGKEIKKPRIMSLINLKAGLLWSEMSDEEKDNWKDTSDIVNESEIKTANIKLDANNSYDEPSLSSKAKKGRPSGYKPKNYTSECSVKKAIDVVETGNNEEVELEEFIFKGNEYLKDENGVVYNMECVEIGNLDENLEIVFN